MDEEQIIFSADLVEMGSFESQVNFICIPDEKLLRICILIGKAESSVFFRCSDKLSDVDLLVSVYYVYPAVIIKEDGIVVIEIVKGIFFPGPSMEGEE